MARLSIDFMSEAVKRAITIHVVVPGDHCVMANQPLPEKNRPYKTLYILEGVIGNAGGPLNYSMLQNMAEDYNLVVVTIGGENHWYSSKCGTGEDYQAMVCKDIVNFTRRTFNLSRRREDTFIGGFSMGGYGALVLGLGHPELFGKIIALSSALNKWPIIDSTNQPDWDMYTRDNYRAMFSLEDTKDYADSADDYEYLAKKTAALGKDKMPAIFMGRGDLDENCRDADNAFRQDLIDLGYDVSYAAYPGRHNYHAFNYGMEKGIKWLGTDGFDENMHYYGRDIAGTDASNFAHWNAWYNLEMEEA